MQIKTAFILAFFSILGATHARADDAPPAVKTFAHAYEIALHAHDAGALRSLVDPASVACIDRASPVWFDQQAHLFTDAEMTGEPVISMRNFSGPLPKGAAFPGQPSSQLVTITWNTGAGVKNSSASAQIGIIQAGNKVFQVLPCPTADDIARRNAFFIENKGYKPPPR